MKIKPFVDRLEQSKEYKDFRARYPKSFMIAGFFILDFESGSNVHQIDFFVPSEKKIAAFTLDGGVSMQLLEMMNSKVPEELSLDTKIDLDALEGILLDEMHNRGMSEKIKKIIAIIQNINGKKIWNLNCVLSGMEILKSHVEDDSMTVLKIEKQSLLDIIQQIPGKKLMKVAGAAEAGGEKDYGKEIENLSKIEEEIEKEKTKLKDEMAKKTPKKKTNPVKKKK
jgi:hypothetical protein